MDLPRIRDTQSGCFTIAQAEPLGWSRFALRRSVASGRLALVRPGVYAEAEVFNALEGREQHKVRLLAEQLALGSHWYAARRSAAVVFDLPLIGADPDVPQLLAPADRVRGSQRSRHRRIAPLPVDDRRVLEGISVVSGARMVADVARAETFRNAVVLADALLARGYDRQLLVQVVEGMKGWPDVATARAVVDFADGLAESPLESISRVAFRALSMPEPELQVEVWLGTRLLGRVDFLWRGWNTVGECDGVAKFGAAEEERAAAFRAMKVRQEWLEDVGLEVPRWGWGEAERPRGVLDVRLGRAFERGSQRVLDPRVRFVPTSVADSRRPAA